MPANAWDLDPATKFVAALGAKALADGTVSPEDAKQGYSSLSGSPMSSLAANPVTSGNGGFSLSPMLSMQQNPMFSKIDLTKPNAHAIQTDTAKQDITHGSKQTTWMSPEQYDQFRKSYLSTPEMQSQESGIQNMQDSYDQQKDLQKNLPHMDWSPLLALADSQTGSKTLQGYKAPQSPEDLAKSQLGMLSTVQDKKQQLSKDVIDAINRMKSGSVSDQYMQALTNATNAGIGSAGGAGGGLATPRRNALIAQSGNDFDKDKVLGQMVQTTNNLNRASNIMNGKTPVTVQMFNDIQKDLANALAPGGAATEGNMNRTILTTLAGNLNALQSKFGGVKDLRKEQPQIFAQLQGFINQVQDEYNKAGADRLQLKAANWRNVPDDLIQKTVDDKIGKYTKFFSPDNTSSGMSKVKVSNGSETLMIPLSDLAEAQKEGYHKL